MAKTKGLGKGLDALFIDNQTADAAVSVLKVTEIEPNKDQPRSLFDEAALTELADSIREHGVLQPLVVRPLESSGYQIVAGERRWRASRMAGLSEVPVVIRELDDLQTLEIAIIENLQREDLNVIELAKGYKDLMDNFNMTQEQVADRVGKSRPVVANTVRLLNLPEQVLDYVRDNRLSQGHAKALLGFEDEKLLVEVAEKAISGGVLVRDIERMARQSKETPKDKQVMKKQEKEAKPAWGDSFHKEMELALSVELGRKVFINSTGKRSTITLEFYNNEELADIAERLAGNKQR